MLLSYNSLAQHLNGWISNSMYIFGFGSWASIDEKFKHENWWGWLGFSQIAGCAQQSGWTRVNLTNFHALISYYLVAAEGGESNNPPITLFVR